MKKILILDTGKEWGGGTNSLIELLKRIDKSKYQFTALFYNNYVKGSESMLQDELEELGIGLLLLEQKKQPFTAKVLKEIARVIFFFSKSVQRYLVFLIGYHFRIKRNAYQISEIMRSLHIDFLYMNNQPSSNLEGILASKLSGVPCVQHARIESRLNNTEVRATNQWARKVICVSEGVKDSLVQQGVNPNKCTVVHNGIDPACRPQISPLEIRGKWGISDNDVLIGTVGSLVRRKRIKDLIEAIPSIVRAGHPVRLLIVGEGAEKEALSREVQKRGLANSVVFAGFQSDALSHINAMDIFVLPSEKEGLPRVILEAMLMGKPVVASNIAGPAELVIDGETGFLVPVAQPAALADAILKLTNDEQLRTQMGERGKGRVIERFSIDQYVNGVERTFDEVLKK